MIVRFSDSDYSLYVLNAAEKYCDDYNRIVCYWKAIKKPEKIKELTERYSSINFIQKFLIQNIVGDKIKNLPLDRDNLDVYTFENIIRIAKELFDDYKFTIVPDNEFDKSQLGYCEHLVLYFQNDTINYDVL